MSEIVLGNLNGEEISASVFSDHQPETISVKLDFVTNFRHLETPDYALNFTQGNYHLVDCGGGGDCLIRAFNYLYGSIFNEKPVSSESWYNCWNLEFGTYLEAEHIHDIAVYYKVCICVVREFEEELFAQVFGETTDYPWLYIYNQYPVHYYAICFTQESESESEEDSEESSGSSESLSSSGSEIEQLSYLNPSLNPAPTFINICSFMANSFKFQYSNVFQVLSSFRILHFEVVLMIRALSKIGRVPSPLFFKLYYKFRHNTFAFICRFSVDGCKDFETDTPLSKYINSNKTPDVIIETADRIDIVEFTVSNRYDVADFNKGGGNRSIKYENEAGLIQKSTGKLTRVHLISAILNEYNLDEIITEMKSLGASVDSEVLSDFYSICNDNRNVINDGQLRASFVKDLPTLDTDLACYERPMAPQTIMMPPEMLDSLLKSIDRFKATTSLILAKSRNQYIRVCYDIATGGTYLQYDKKYTPKLTGGEFLSELGRHGITYLVSVLQLFKEGSRASWSELRGTVPVTVNREMVIKVKKMERPVYMTSNIYESDYIPEGEFEQLKTAGYLDIKSNSKVFFPEDYFEKLCRYSFDNIMNSKSKKLLYNCRFDQEDLNECISIFNETQKSKNLVLNFSYHPKPTFLLPIPQSFTVQNEGLPDIITKYLPFSNGYTREVLNKASKGQFCLTRNTKEADLKVSELKDSLNRANIDLFNKLQQSNLLGKKISTLTAQEKNKISLERERVFAAKRDYSDFLSTLKGTRNEHLVKMSRGKKSRIEILFKQEMSHYKGDKSVFRGVGQLQPERIIEFDKFLKAFIGSLHDEVEMPIVPLFNSIRSPGPKLLTDLKNMYTERAVEFAKEHFYQKKVDGITTFYSKLAVHLFNESTKSYNSSFVKVDNLGYKNIVVLVRGGSKIYKHQVSRLFKIICFVEPNVAGHLGYLENKNYKTHAEPNGVMVETPWSQLHQDVLFDYMSMRERTFMNMFSAQTRITQSISDPIRPLTMLPFILSLHNRRKTETFMHNSRYLIVNPLAQHANLQGLIGSFAGFNYTYLDAWLRYRLETGYESFASQMMRAKNLKGGKIDSILSHGVLRDLWLNTPLENADQLTNFIYITYMMTKAPVNSSLEQAGNLWEILEDVKNYSISHPKVEKLADHSQRFNLFHDTDSVYEDDFKYDPVFCNYLGHHMVGYLNNVLSPVEIANHWEQLKRQDLSSIANSNGLRGWHNRNFFNKKGYEVVFEKIDNILEGEDFQLVDLVNKYLEADHLTSLQMVKDDVINLESAEKNLIFHIVHKIQRGGGREIFCMDLDTKYRQNPIEKLMKFICKRVPNEYISIPSNKRHGLIHSDFYEKKINRETNFVYRWVLDCRRWAPHSVFQKYVYFIEGLAPMLPTDFVEYFRDFADKMFTKKFITREHVYNKIKNNVRFAEYESLLKLSELISGAYEMTVKFSFVMGIFNYLSTLMHAANQIVASEVIRNQCIKNGEGLVILDPKCHSDDSVVSSYHQKNESLKRSVILYDWLLKGANHMLSIKKSQINADVYLEFLSVLYLFDRFLPVLPKFSSSLPFKPSDKGYSSDVSFAITQSIEMLSQGGSYEEAFLMMKLTERFVQNCYRINYVAELPYQMLGCIDSHPIELLYSGGLSDLYRSMCFNTENFWRAHGLLSKMGVIEEGKADLMLKWDMSSRLSGGPKDIKEKYSFILENLGEDCSWTISNLKLGNGYLNLLWYVNKLKDKMFYSSLVDEPAARKFGRMFGSAAYRFLVGKNEQRFSVEKVGISLSEFIKTNEPYAEDPIFRDFLDFCCRDLKFFYRSIEDATISNIEISNVKEKPVVFYQSLPTMGTITISAAEYVSYTKEPQGYKLLGKRSNPVRECDKITNQLILLGLDTSSLSKDQLYAAARKITKDEQKSFRLIMPMPGDERKVDGYTDAVKTLCYNSLKWKRITIRARNTAAVDWSRRMVSGKLPETVTHFLQCYWFEKLCEKYRVTEYDIFVERPSLDQLRSEVPDEWKPIINAELNPKQHLEDMPYWCCWTQEQVKLGNNWYGSGECIISIPEAILKLSITNGKIKSVAISSSHTGPLSTASNWYLNVFFYYSGLSVDVVPKEFGSPNDIYMGHDDEGRYKIGRAGTMSQIFIDSTIDYTITPSFAQKNLRYTQKGSTVIYHDDNRDYKVNFFIPLDQPVVLDLTEFIDKNKLRNLLPVEPRLNEFVQDYATSVLGYSKKDPDFLKRNIDSSLLYNIIYNYSEKTKVFDNLGGNLPIISAVREWKQNHPGFGFPSDENLAILAKSGNVAPLSVKMLDFVKKLGMMEMSQIEFDTVMAKILSLPSEEREHYLINMYPHLLKDQQAGSLVVLQKSDRIFTSCAFVRDQQYYLVIEFFKLLIEAIETSGLHSSVVDQWKTALSSGHGGRVKDGDIILSILAQFCVESVQGQSDYATSYKSAGLLYSLTEELLDKGIATWLNIASLTNTLFRSVEFKVDPSLILDWLNDLLDNLTFSIGLPPDQLLSYQVLMGEKRGTLRQGKFYEQWSGIGKFVSRIDFDRPSETLTLMRKSRISQSDKFGYKKPRKDDIMKLDLTKDTMPGIAVEPFVPLDEEWQEEFDLSWEYEDQLEDYERDEDADIPRYAYCYSADLSKRSLTKIRGTAWNLYIAFNHLNSDINVCADKKTFFEPIVPSKKNNLYNFMMPEVKICHVGSKNSKWVPKGYKKVPWETVRTWFKDSYEHHHQISINDQEYGKKEVISDPALTQNIPNLDSYFKRVTGAALEKEVVKNEAVLDFVSTNMFMSPEYEKQKEQLDSMLKTLHSVTESEQEEEEKGADTVNIIDHNFLSDILAKQTNLLDEISSLITTGGSNSALLVERGTASYNFSEPTDLITDLGFKSEFETLFPGFWLSIMNKEISLTRNQKRDRLTLAKLKIASMTGNEKRNATMLYQVVMFVLNEIPDSGGIPNVSNAFMLHIDSMFKYEEDEITEEGLVSFNQLHARPIMLIPEQIEEFFH